MNTSYKIVIAMFLLAVSISSIYYFFIYDLGPYAFRKMCCYGIQLVDYKCNENTQAIIVFRNAGTQNINLGNCTGAYSITGTNYICGNLTITRTEGGTMRASFSNESINPGQFYTLNDTCTVLGTPKTCTYIFTESSGERDIATISCPG